MQDIDLVMKLVNVTLLYEKNIGLKKLDLNIPKGKIYGFLGRNGAGKTTALQILSGVYRPQIGQIVFNGERSNEVKAAWKKRIGYVPQIPVFPPNVNAKQTAWLLSQLYPSWSELRFTKLASAFQLPLQQGVDTYSYGMKTMLSMSLAYAYDPEIYILDEPTSGLDPVSRRFVLDLIKQEAGKGKSIIFSTHIVDDLYDNCAFLGIIDYGEMLQEGEIANFGDSKKSLEENYFQLIKYRRTENVVGAA